MEFYPLGGYVGEEAAGLKDAEEDFTGGLTGECEGGLSAPAARSRVIVCFAV